MSTKTFKYILDFSGNTSRITQQVGGLQGALKSAAVAAGALFSVRAVINFAQKTAEAYDVQAKAEQSLLVALNGRKYIQQQLIRQAGELQKKTLFGDEETIKAQALIAAFVKEGDQIERVIPLVQDLATAKGMDLAAAADLVSKTLGSSTNALARYGIQVEGSVGSVERLESLVTNLNDAFGGQAEAAAQVGTAAVTQLSNAYGDLKEVLGELTIESQNNEKSFTKILTSATEGVTGFFKKMSTYSKAGLGFVDSLTAAIFRSAENTEKLQNILDGTNEQDAFEKPKVIVESVADRLKVLNEQLQVAQRNARDTSNVELFVQGQKDVASLTKQIDELNAYIDSTKAMPRDNTLYQKMEMRHISSVESNVNINTNQLGDITPMLERNQQLLESLRSTWTNFGDDFNASMDKLAEGGNKITDATILAGDMVNNMMGLAQQGVGSLREWASAVRDAAMSAINAFIAEGIAGAVSTALAKSGIPFPLNMVAGAIAATGATALLNSVIPKFEFGGVVPGTFFTGDRVIARLNSGEEVLRRDDPRHVFNGGKNERTSGGRDRIFIGRTRIDRGHIYIAYEEAKAEIYNLT